jgi:hypothetical protein
MLLFGAGLAVGVVGTSVLVHFMVIRKLRDRITYIENQFKRRFASIV